MGGGCGDGSMLCVSVVGESGENISGGDAKNVGVDGAVEASGDDVSFCSVSSDGDCISGDADVSWVCAGEDEECTEEAE